jgi:tetratricopeptide (TPR) repeat protein
VSLGDYTGFSLDENFENFDDRKLATMDWTSSPIPTNASSIRGTARQQSSDAFRQAYMSFHNDYDWEATVDHLSRAVELAPDEGDYWIARGHVQMRLKRHGDALQSFLKAEQCKLGLHMKQTNLLFLGHAYDALGRRNEALTRYRALEAARPLSPHIARELKQNLKQPYGPNRAEDITFDFQYCDSMEYA